MSKATKKKSSTQKPTKKSKTHAAPPPTRRHAAKASPTTKKAASSKAASKKAGSNKETTEQSRPTKAPRTPKQPTPAGAATRKATTASNRGRFLIMSLDELRATYLEVVGRPTGSSDRRYLAWKIREAEAGRVPVGPRKVTPRGEPRAVMVLPLRLPTEHVDKMDTVWRSHGMRSRMTFLRAAIHRLLVHLHAPEAAALFAEARA